MTLFLGVVFRQYDDAAVKEEKKETFFAWPFMAGPVNEKLLIKARTDFASSPGRFAS
jgi:hypothetical protein